MSKVQLSGNVSGTGIFTIASPNSNTDRTLTLPDNTGTILTGSSAIQTSQLPAGSVLQVVQGTLTASVTSTSSTYADTGLQATITPSSASNKILVIVTHNGVYKTNSGTGMNQRLLKNGSLLTTFQIAAAWTGSASSAENIVGTNGVTYLDSPSSTSALTYKTQIASYANSNRVVLNANSGDLSTIVLMEIAG